MASIQRSGRRWRVQVAIKGQRDSATFSTKQEAAQWALQREAELSGARLPDRTFGDAMTRYSREVAPLHQGARWEQVRLKALGTHPIARRRLAGLARDDFAQWRDDRLGQVAPATVAREMTLLRSVLEACRRDWRWLNANPMQDVRWPKPPRSRRRRVTADEIERLTLAHGLGDALAVDTLTQRTGLAFLLGLETAMRASEMLGLQWADVDLKARFVRLPKTKNGDAREVPLTRRAVTILKVFPRADGPVIGLKDAQRDALFRKARDRAKLPDLHFHDARAEAIWRLSKKLDVLQLARAIGHRDPKSLLLYYDESAADMAKRLD